MTSSAPSDFTSSRFFVLVTGRELLDCRPHGLDHAGEIAAKDRLPRPAKAEDGATHQLEATAAAAVGLARSAVGARHRDGVDPDQDLVVPGERLFYVFDVQDVGASVPVVDDCPHRLRTLVRIAPMRLHDAGPDSFHLTSSCSYLVDTDRGLNWAV